MKTILILLKGLAVGIANIIPGVSGGTMALMLGIYERILNALGNISIATIKSCFGLLTFKKEAREAFVKEMKQIDAGFMALLGVGAAIGIGALAKIMTFLLSQQHDPTYAFFFGLVMISAVVPYKMMKSRGWQVWVAVVIACLIVIGLDMGMSSDEKEKNANSKIEIKLAKADLKKAKESGDEAAEKSAIAKIESLGGEKSSSIMKLGYLFIAGAVSISAMILPGISGSFLLLLFGLYFEILAAITRFDIVTLAVFGAGCGLGLLVFTRLLNWLMKRFHDTTMGFLLGLMIGSLWSIWPFKESAIVGKGTVLEDTIFLSNTMPQAFDMNTILCLVTFAVGAGIVGLFLHFETDSSKD